MQKFNLQQTIAEITDLLAASMAIRIDSPGADLLETGVLDSLALVRLVNAIAERYGIESAELLADLDSFRSVEAIAVMVTGSRPGAGADLVSEIRSVLLETLSVRVDSPDDDLFRAGVLDSIALVRFIMALENRFAVEIPIDEVDVAAFRSIADVASMIGGFLNPRPPEAARRIGR